MHYKVFQIHPIWFDHSAFPADGPYLCHPGPSLEAETSTHAWQRMGIGTPPAPSTSHCSRAENCGTFPEVRTIRSPIDGYRLNQSAQAIGMTRRMIAYYKSGARPIPKTVWMACIGYESLQHEAA
jgi:hypothetical protein